MFDVRYGLMQAVTALANEQLAQERIEDAEPKAETKAEKARRFLQSLEDSEQRQAEREAELLLTMETPREMRFMQDMAQLITEAAWIERLKQFPDGQSLYRQNPWRLAMWDLFIGAMNEKAYGKEEAMNDAG
jgi:hypothetical protein